MQTHDDLIIWFNISVSIYIYIYINYNYMYVQKKQKKNKITRIFLFFFIWNWKEAIKMCQIKFYLICFSIIDLVYIKLI